VRRVGGGRVDVEAVHVMHIACGPGGPHSPTVGALEREWLLVRDWYEDKYPSPLAQRVWAWWVFEAGEEPPAPPDQALRLAELGQLTDTEIEELDTEAERALARLGTSEERWSYSYRLGEHSVDRRLIDRHDRIAAALR
jgi:hypothetical protein